MLSQLGVLQLLAGLSHFLLSCLFGAFGYFGKGFGGSLVSKSFLVTRGAGYVLGCIEDVFAYFLLAFLSFGQGGSFRVSLAT